MQQQGVWHITTQPVTWVHACTYVGTDRWAFTAPDRLYTANSFQNLVHSLFWSIEMEHKGQHTASHQVLSITCISTGASRTFGGSWLLKADSMLIFFVNLLKLTSCCGLYVKININSPASMSMLLLVRYTNSKIRVFTWNKLEIKAMWLFHLLCVNDNTGLFIFGSFVM